MIPTNDYQCLCDYVTSGTRRPERVFPEYMHTLRRYVQPIIIRVIIYVYIYMCV